MPRIKASSIELHVRQQTERLLDAASELFRSRGYRATDMEDIAASIGLARNSLYRYYPGKDHILIACVRRDIGPFAEQLRRLPERHPDPRARVAAWLDLQLDIATSPVHATLGLMGEIREASPELRREITALRAATGAVLATAIGERVAGRRRDAGLVTALVTGMVEAAAAEAMRRPGRVAAIRREIRRAVDRVIDA